jgi:hypothetical protein
MKNITELKNALEGNDVFVIASGPSAGYIDPEFFANKWSIGVNEVYRRFVPDFLLRKEAMRANDFADAARRMGAQSVISRHDCGMYSRKQNPDVCDYVFDHPDNGMETIDLSPVGREDELGLVVSYSTITSAIHLAAYMGAANIILVGHDCGLLDGGINMPDYPPSLGGQAFYRRWVSVIEPQTAALRARLREVYGCRIYSLNPFLNFGLEGHSYER